MINQPEHGSHIAEQLKRLRQAQPIFSEADSELFDIEKIEEQTRQALKQNRKLNEELKRIKEEQIRLKAEASGLYSNMFNRGKKERRSTRFVVRLMDIPPAPTVIKIKTQAEQIDEMRENIFDLLDRMSSKKQELSEKFIPVSICTQLQQAIRDAEVPFFLLLL